MSTIASARVRANLPSSVEIRSSHQVSGWPRHVGALWKELDGGTSRQGDVGYRCGQSINPSRGRAAAALSSPETDRTGEDQFSAHATTAQAPSKPGNRAVAQALPQTGCVGPAPSEAKMPKTHSNVTRKSRLESDDLARVAGMIVIVGAFAVVMAVTAGLI